MPEPLAIGKLIDPFGDADGAYNATSQKFIDNKSVSAAGSKSSFKDNMRATWTNLASGR